MLVITIIVSLWLTQAWRVEGKEGEFYSCELVRLSIVVAWLHLSMIFDALYFDSILMDLQTIQLELCEW